MPEMQIQFSPRGRSGTARPHNFRKSRSARVGVHRNRPQGVKQTLDIGTLIHASTSDSFWGRASAGAHAHSFELGLNHRLYIKDGRSHVTSPSVLLFALFWHIEASVFCSFVSRSDQIWMSTDLSAEPVSQWFCLPTFIKTKISGYVLLIYF